MDTADIAKLCQSLSLSDEEGSLCRIEGEIKEESLEDVNHCLVGKILAPKKVNREAFKTVIEQLWSAFGKVEIEAIGDNVFLFYFNRKEDRNLVWNRGPWHFDHSLIVLEKPHGAGDVSKLDFNRLEIWVQIHNIPLICMNRRVAQIMATQIGEVVEIPAESKECRGRFLRVKVRIDISKPLRRCLKLNLEGSEDISVVLLKYERLPEFCFVCGIIGHCSRDCMDTNAKNAALNGSTLKYGSWMRANIVDWGKSKTDPNKVTYGDKGTRRETLVDLPIGTSGGRSLAGSKTNLTTEDSENSTPIQENLVGGEKQLIDPIVTCRVEVAHPCYEDDTDKRKQVDVQPGDATEGTDVSNNINIGTPLDDLMKVDSSIDVPVAGKMPKAVEESLKDEMSVSPNRKSTRKWKRAAREASTMGQVTSPIQKMLAIQHSRRKNLITKDEMSVSPNRKSTRKWKRAAREASTMGQVTSPIQKMLDSRRKNNRGNSLSPKQKDHQGQPVT